MAEARDVAQTLARLSHGIARKVDEAPTGVVPGYSAALGGTVKPNGKLLYTSPSGVPGALLAHYTRGASNQSVSVGSETRLNWASQVYDPSNTVTTGASWKFTAPLAGTYAIEAHCSVDDFASGTIIAAEFCDLFIRNDSDNSYLGMIDYRDVTPRASGADSRFLYLHGRFSIVLTAGQAIYIVAENQTSVAVKALYAATDQITIYRIA